MKFNVSFETVSLGLFDTFSGRMYFWTIGNFRGLISNEILLFLF
jgi:hypothetical protein